MSLCLSPVCLTLLILIFFVLLLKLYIEITKGRVTSNTYLTGKTVLITGGDSGLGYYTALALASRGAKVIIADIQDSTETRKKIIQQTGNPNIISKIFDLSSLSSVRKLAKEINEEEDRLDILINNAGIGYSSKITQDGLTEQMQVNHFGPFLLTHLLMNLLKKSAPSRIIFVSSLLAFTNNLRPANINQVSYNTIAAYGNSKLCNMITSNIFAEKLAGTGVTSNSVHPGVVTTEIYRRACTVVPNILLDLFYFIIKFLGKTPLEGAQCQIQCALSKRLTTTTGKYFVDCIPFNQPSSAKNKMFSQKVWDLSEELVKLKPEEKL